MTAALLIIDMQKAFFEDASLGKQQDSLVAACNSAIADAREAGIAVYLIRTEHQRDKSTWTVSMLDDEQGFLFSGTEQAEFVDGLSAGGLPELVKTRDSAFFGTDLLQRLRNLNVDTVVLAGVSTHNCVAQTGADAYANNLRVVYAEEAVASTNDQYAQNVLGVLRDEYRQQALGASGIRQLFSKQSARQSPDQTPML
ncbi:cysteine hydrolase [Arthrobacter tumbae]|uniref:cysteine hydrolase family protein n=1 Tax=Arthrobacter tumbae TaxID=163874 RepID=UPI001959AB3A|nr:isochorismatase family cysteine hydrolase [Arthrobacter tumbae]MBM7781438.1 nicotinamidase-related amidase [Arthrobacter tumbae]